MNASRRRPSVRSLDPEAEPAQLQNYASTPEFLAAEGFIRTGSTTFDGLRILEAGLTMKGSAILDSVPASVQETTPLGRKITDALKSGSKEAIRTVVNQVISAAVTVGLSNMSR